MASRHTQELTRHVLSTIRLVKEKFRSIRQTSQLSFHQVETLRYIKEQGMPLMREIAGRAAITPPSATLLIESLVRQKLLRRHLDPEDRRAIRLSLTKLGVKKMKTAEQQIARNLQLVFSHLSDKEQKDLLKILSTLSATYQK